MSTPQADPLEAQRYFDLLYSDAPPDAYLVVSWRTRPEAPLKHRWIRGAHINHEGIAKFAQKADIWIGVGLRHPDCTPAEERRGTNEDVCAIPGLWIDFDHTGGTHAAKNLPTQQELLSFIETLPFRFSLLIDTSGGYHGYLLFKELWILNTSAEREAAALLLRCFQRTLQVSAAAQGWKVDSTADLARVLRPPGTLNHKSEPPKPVTIAHEDAIRYNPSDIAAAPWLATVEDMYVPEAGRGTPSACHGSFPPTQLDPIVTGCAWLRHCRDDAATLTEPEWYAEEAPACPR